MDYGQVLSRSWQIAWRNKVLWLFGFMASLFLMNSTNVNGNVLMDIAGDQVMDFITSPTFFQTMGILWGVYLLLSLVVAFVKALGRSGLIDQVNRAEDGASPSFGGGWAASRRYGWRVFWIKFILDLPGTAVLMLGFAPLVFTSMSAVRYFMGIEGGRPPDMNLRQAMFGAFAFLVPACCAAVLLFTFFSWIAALGERACVLEDLSLGKSIGRGWQLLREKFGQVFVMWLILTAINLVIFVPLMALAAFGVIPVLLGFTSLAREAQTGGLWILFGGYFCTGGLVWVWGMLIGSVLEPFLSGGWTLAYRTWASLPPTGDQPGEDQPEQGLEAA